MLPDYRDVAAHAQQRAGWLVPVWLPKGKRQGRYWLAFNPKRADRRLGSFRVNLQTGQWGDFATGNTGGDLISLKAYLLNATQRQACDLLALELGQRHASTLAQTFPPTSGARWKVAASIWAESLPVTQDSLVMDYLRGRGLEMVQVPQGLRFHPKLKERTTGQYFPALVAKVSNVQGDLRGIHRIFLSPYGTKANIADPKQMLGEVAGGAVRLTEATECVVVAEGIETALAVHEMFELPTWASLSTSGMRRVQLPVQIKTVYVAVDYDANAAGEEAGMALLHRLLSEGRNAMLLHPKRVIGKLPKECKGLDWLDVLNKEGELHHAA